MSTPVEAVEAKQVPYLVPGIPKKFQPISKVAAVARTMMNLRPGQILVVLDLPEAKYNTAQSFSDRLRRLGVKARTRKSDGRVRVYATATKVQKRAIYKARKDPSKGRKATRAAAAAK